MARINKYELKDYVPEVIAQTVRKRCGFGCVKCGCSIYHYHHFDPPFESAKEHNAEGITLLCPTCHQAAHKEILSISTIEDFNKNPYCLREGFSQYAYDLENLSEVILGTITFIDNPKMIEAFGECLLQIEPPEEPGRYPLLSAKFYDPSGKLIAKICRNVWYGNAENWDIKSEGKKVTIREAIREIVLILRFEAPIRLVVERINMFYKGLKIVGMEGKSTKVYLPDGRLWFSTNHMRMIGNRHGILLQ